MNLQQFHNRKSQGKTAITIYGQHKPSPQNKSIPTKEEFDILFTHTTSKNPKKIKTATKLELCIGSTVMLLNNLGTEVGLTNGTLGKLIAIGYLQKTSTSSTLSDEEPPVFFIQFPTLKCNATALPGYEKVIHITFMSSLLVKLMPSIIIYFIDGKCL